jgi:hypothetical protein
LHGAFCFADVTHYGLFDWITKWREEGFWRLV